MTLKNNSERMWCGLCMWCVLVVCGCALCCGVCMWGAVCGVYGVGCCVCGVYGVCCMWYVVWCGGTTHTHHTTFMWYLRVVCGVCGVFVVCGMCV